MMRSRARGFTLVEVVVALTLVSLIMLGLVSALRSFGDTSARLEARSLHADELRLVGGFLREAIAASSPRLHMMADQQQHAPWFIGNAEELIWLGSVPARHGLGGLHHMRLSLQRDGAGQRLWLQFSPFVGDDQPPDWSQEPGQLLIDQVDGLVISYQRLGRYDWQPLWDDPMVLPGRVRLQLSAAGVAWPELVIAVLRAEPGFDPENPNAAGAGAGVPVPAAPVNRGDGFMPGG